MKTINELFNLKNKTAVVTGGLGHLGFAMTETLLELGADVMITVTEKESTDTETLAKLATLKRDYPKQSTSIQVIDFFDDAPLKKFFGSLKKVDILINNAYFTVPKPMESMNFEEFNKSVEGTLASVYKCSTLAFPLMKKQKKGVIINLGSMYGMVSPDWKAYKGNLFNSPASYGPSKAGVIQLTKYLAGYWAQYGIRVNSISPGPFPNINRVKDKKFLAMLASKTMLGRIGTPEDLKGVIALLSSDASSYMTGQNITIDGGWTAW